MKTNVGKKFLKLIEVSFPPENPLHKLFNRNTVKMSYKCMPNISQAISRHNSRLFNQNDQQHEQSESGCNCQGGIGSCPVAGECKKSNVVYRAAVTTDNGNTEYYTGLTGNKFKERYSGHKTSFNHQKYMHKSTLSTHIWKLKNENTNFTTNWSLVDRATKFNPTTRKCRLCLKEKWYIMFKPQTATLNERSEFFTVCRHRLRGLLVNS